MNVLVIGLGSAGKKHVSAIRKIDPEASIWAFRSGTGGEDVAGVTNIRSLDALPVRPDFAVISNITVSHAEVLRAVLPLDCAVFIEKPLFSTLEGGKELVEKVRSRGIISYVACNMRFHPVIRFLKSYLQEKVPRINEVNIYCGSWLPGWRPGKDFRTTYSASEALGGGAHLDLVHELDYCSWLFGLPERSVALRTSRSSLSINAVDRAHYEWAYADFVAAITVNYYRRDARRSIEIVTDEDTIAADLLSGEVRSELTGNLLFNQPFDMAQTYIEQMKYFIDHVNKRVQPMNSVEEGWNILKLALHE